MTGPDALRYIVAGMSALVSGAVIVVIAAYLRAWWRAPRRHGARPRHVTEVAVAALGLVAGYGYLSYNATGEGRPLTWVTWLFLASMALLLLGVLDIGNLQRRRREPPDDGGRHRR